VIKKNSNLFRFARALWLTLVVLLAFAVTFTVYISTERKVERAYLVRQKTLLLAEQWRQSSDDLTRMVRSYVVTGNAIYRQHYQEIIDIRDGNQSRPLHYDDGYWDLVLPDDRRAWPAGAALALLDAMRDAGFTGEEFSILEQAKANSEALSAIELAAMALIEADSGAARSAQSQIEANAVAIRMVNDATYQSSKAGIMRPISEFHGMAERRTLAAVLTAEERARQMRFAAMLFGLLLAATLWNLKRSLYSMLGAPADQLHALIARLGNGDFSSIIPVAPGKADSVMGWLSQARAKLASSDARRHVAQAKSQRVSRLYAALSQCNRAIIGSAGETELFAKICHDVVIFGAMKMAWIGLLDAQGKLLPVAAFGSGTDYLKARDVSLDPALLSGRDPIALAFHQRRPVWCQDLLHDPASADWCECGQRYGWAASATLPLYRDGSIAGFLVTYAGVANAFDEDVRQLLVEMAGNIDAALKNFSRNAQREQSVSALRYSEQRLRTIIETEPDAITLTNRGGWLQEINPAGLAMLEAATLQDLKQHNIVDLILPEYRADFLAMFARVMRGEIGTLEYQVRGLKGTLLWIETRTAPIPEPEGAGIMLLGISRDISARKIAEERMQFLAHFDALTGLPNRVLLHDRVQYALSLAQRSVEPVTLMSLDLDHFKDVNDAVGHSAGDALLAELARRLRLALRDEDTVSRTGSDEFIVLLYGVHAQGAAKMAQKLMDVIAQPFYAGLHDLNVTASIGIAMYPIDGVDMETLFKSADVALHQIKQGGRHGYRFSTAEMQMRSARNVHLVRALRRALELNELQVHYQPQIALDDGRIIGAEALLRWNCAELGAVSPAEFIPAAEDSGLILPIGEWVLRQAVRQAKSWTLRGMAPLIMAVNLSAVQFRHADLPQLVTRILDEEGLAPQYLELELTEGVAMHDPQGAIATMDNLFRRGVRMSIDDFGTGYSSLSQLKKFKVYKLKIDQSFVRDICNDPEDRALVGAIINMAKSLGLYTIAEGVETEGQLAFLREQGCDEMQGYYCSPALAADKFEAFARRPG
jgi:diguanylate cyclase (GGDEF)-like protein/PAS domain S-box-containing protein